MDQALGWIGELIHWLRGAILPSLQVIACNEVGIRYRRGQEAEEVSPGLCWYWDLTTTLETVPTTERRGESADQVLVTKDGSTLGLTVAYRYVVQDPVVWSSRYEDPEETLGDLVMAAARNQIGFHPRGRILEMAAETLDGGLKERLADDLLVLGVDLKDIHYTNLAPCRALAILGQPTHASED